MDNLVMIRIDRVYGVLTIYPDNKQAELFAKIAGTKTLTQATLKSILELGYEVKETPPEAFVTRLANCPAGA